MTFVNFLPDKFPELEHEYWKYLYNFSIDISTQRQGTQGKENKRALKSRKASGTAAKLTNLRSTTKHASNCTRYVVRLRSKNGSCSKIHIHALRKSRSLHKSMLTVIKEVRSKEGDETQSKSRSFPPEWRQNSNGIRELAGNKRAIHQ